MVLDLTTGLSGTGVLVVLEVLLVAVALVIAPRNREPSSALAWVLLMALIPLVGIVLFALIGSPKLPHKRRAKQRNANELIEEVSAGSARSSPARTRRRGCPRWPGSWSRSAR